MGVPQIPQRRLIIISFIEFPLKSFTFINFNTPIPFHTWNKVQPVLDFISNFADSD